MKRFAWMAQVLVAMLFVLSVSCGKDSSPTGLDNGGDGGIDIGVGDPPDIQGMTFVTIPGGSFRMGDIQGGGSDNERPDNEITLDGFEMSITEVTQVQYVSVIGSDPSQHFTIDNHPVENVSWYDAARFCNTLSEATGLESCYNESTWESDFSRNGFRLPTEAEWEYACRAGTETRFYTGNHISSPKHYSTDLNQAGWYSGNWGNWQGPLAMNTHVVREKEPNAFGLYDMHGNVWEWCNDWYGYSYYGSSPSSNPTGSTSGSDRVVRGGSVSDGAWYCRSAFRGCGPPVLKKYNYGFRVVRRPEQQADSPFEQNKQEPPTLSE